MKDYHHGNLKEVLLEEGLVLLTEEGYRNFSLRKLARRCKVSHSSPYRHFANKEELIKAISTRVNKEFNQALKASIEQETGSPQDVLNALGRGYVYFFLDNPGYLDILFLSPEIQHLVHCAGKKGQGDSFITYLSTVVPTIGEIGNKQAENVTETESLVPGEITGDVLQPWCLIHGLTVLLVKNAIPISDRDKLDHLIEQVIQA